MIRTIVGKSSYAAIETKSRISRCVHTQTLFNHSEWCKVNKEVKEIFVKGSWVPVGPKELTTWQS